MTKTRNKQEKTAPTTSSVAAVSLKPANSVTRIATKRGGSSAAGPGAEALAAAQPQAAASSSAEVDDQRSEASSSSGSDKSDIDGDEIGSDAPSDDEPSKKKTRKAAPRAQRVKPIQPPSDGPPSSGSGSGDDDSDSNADYDEEAMASSSKKTVKKKAAPRAKRVKAVKALPKSEGPLLPDLPDDVWREIFAFIGSPLSIARLCIGGGSQVYDVAPLDGGVWVGAIVRRFLPQICARRALQF